MKLLFDANISRRIVPLLEDLFPKSTHTTLAGLAGETSDETVWKFARDHSFASVTADKDFVRKPKPTALHRKSSGWRKWITPPK